jgi:peptide/nickel transport system permease protein
VFFIIELPPGDFLTTYTMNLQAQGEQLEQSLIEGLERRYGLNQPFFVRYWKWVSGFVVGDFGYSFSWELPVRELLAGRVTLTVVVTFVTLMFTWIVALPIGVYSATHRYKAGDHIATFIGFLGVSIPNFMLALILMYIGMRYFGVSVGGLFSPQFVDAPWSVAKFLDMLSHIWIPVVVIGTADTAGLIRVMRANLLDELGRPYVVAAQARGVPRRRRIAKYPVRVAINPFISTVGWLLPKLFSGAAVTAIVLSLPTLGPLLLQALLTQDMYLAGSMVMIISILTVIGTLVSDILLAYADPRIALD